MTGTLVHATAVIRLGAHLLEDNTTLNIEYRTRSLQLLGHPTKDFRAVEVSSQWYDTITWAELVRDQLLVYPEAIEDVDRLSNALNFLSMYEMGVSEMMTLLNIRQNLLLTGERKVLPQRPLRYLTNLTGACSLANWSTDAVQRTTWT